MDLSLSQLLAAGAILFCGSLLQGAVGFAAGLFGMPLLLLIGLGLPEAVTVQLIASSLQNATGAYQMRSAIDYPGAWVPILIRWSGLPIGVAAQYALHEAYRGEAKQVIGIVLLLIVVVYWLWRVKPRDRLHPAWQLPAFGASGFLAAFCGMGGPPMVLWVMAHRWSAAASRAFSFWVSLMGMIPLAGVLYFAYGNKLLLVAGVALLGIPPVLLGTTVGLKIGGKLSKETLRPVCYALLVIIALCAIVVPLGRG